MAAFCVTPRSPLLLLLFDGPSFSPFARVYVRPPAPTFGVCPRIRRPRADLSDLPNFLHYVSTGTYPSLKPIAVDVFNHPEIGNSEYYAHDRVVNYFNAAGLWEVTPHAYGYPTAWSLAFENRPDGSPATLPSVGFMAEYDALPAVGHACGHNLILLNALTAASLTREALIKYNIPGRIVVIGSPDEEQSAGKKRLLDAGAYTGTDVWLLAHPTITNAVQPMQARINAVLNITGVTHFEAVYKAYKQLVMVSNLTLPATASTLSPVEDVGMFVCNVVQTDIELGVVGDINVVNSTVASIKALPAYASVNYTIGTDSTGVYLNFTGPGGHASQGTKNPLSLATDVFKSLTASHPSYSYYLPSNTSHLELDITLDIRTRYTMDLQAVQSYILQYINTIPSSISWDLPYKSLEVTPYFPARLNEVMQQSLLNETWINSTVAPASTDAGWVQNPVIDPNTHVLLSESVPVFHPNFGICPTPNGAGCPFNHEPAFAALASTDLAYNKTEKMARALAQIAVELAGDATKMQQARALVK